MNHNYNTKYFILLTYKDNYAIEYYKPKTKDSMKTKNTKLQSKRSEYSNETKTLHKIATTSNIKAQLGFDMKMDGFQKTQGRLIFIMPKLNLD